MGGDHDAVEIDTAEVGSTLCLEIAPANGAQRRSTLADYTLPVAPVPIRGIIQQADQPHSGQTIECYGEPALGRQGVSWTVTEVATRT
jgi:hypothetical protein